ncbi:histone acetyltransferases subunit 3-domain-containing protein [Cantharellus anzutake]|uniref:histone acetyltransferases subunit 3-domain-containing protein n=1 Tax=Cantharellus anzutake TaxID=1750568 RepID=UPI0019066B0A|nr:histone acetyltransferases subunit 3-domain-containing protein [Cantharellus anzutake]KAF8344132.1 histone acetyltransferases subunit 3-domain-containing protein [Cantharellus anzutake]
MFVGFRFHPRFRSSLLANAQALHAPGVPSTEELEALVRELKQARELTQNRIDKAEADLDTVYTLRAKHEQAKEQDKANRESIARERLKAKKDGGIGKIKREASETPSLEEGPLAVHDSKLRTTGGATRKHAQEEKNKKKRKREERKERDRTIDEGESDVFDVGRASPSGTPLIDRPTKKAKHVPQTAQLTIPQPPSPPPGPPVDPDVCIDWELVKPATASPQPSLGLWGPNGLLHSTPSKQADVNDDFSEAKQPSNPIQIGPFWKEVDSWMRPVGEEDVAWVSYQTDDSESFKVPPLGRHYSETWEEQDQLLAAQHQALFHGDGTSLPPLTPTSGHINGILANAASLNPLTAAGKNPPVPEPLNDKDLSMQKKTLGPFTERVISALLGTPGHPVPPTADAEPHGVGPSSALTIPLAPVSFSDMETRLKLELRACGLIGVDEPDFSQSYDDEVSGELRRLQSELRVVKRMNDARKERLAGVATDRLAYQDYVEMVDDLNKQITSGYQRIIKAQQRNIAGGKKKKGPGQKDSDAAAEAAKAKHLVIEVPEPLQKVIEVRNQFKEVFGKAMIEWEKKQPGRIMGFPLTSNYEDLKNLSLESDNEDDTMQSSVDPFPS